MMIELFTPIIFVINACIGALGYCLFWKIYEKNELLRHLGLAIIGGYIYYLMYSQWTFPNLIMSIVIGWFAPDLVSSIMERLKPE